MTKVIHLPSPRVGIRVHTSEQTASGAHTPKHNTNPIERQAAIENALSMALYFIRQPGDLAANVWAATARTNRALTLLKQASTANSSGRV